MTTEPSCEWSGNAVCSAIIDRSPDYELDDVLVVEEPQQLRALADPLRGRIITLLRQRAASTTELASALDTPKGTVGHHLKVLEKAGLVRVVRTRKVRALTEKYYGRVARLFVLKTDDSMPDELRRSALAAMMLRQAADELIAARRREGDVGHPPRASRTGRRAPLPETAEPPHRGLPERRGSRRGDARACVRPLPGDARSCRSRVTMPRLWPTGGLWRHRDFLKLWSAETISQFGSQVDDLAIGFVAIVVLDASAFEVAAARNASTSSRSSSSRCLRESGSTGCREGRS